MTLRSTRRLTASIGLLLAVQLLTSFGTIVLLGRMSPAIERILNENVASVQAVEQMALALAASDPDAPRRFRDGLAKAKGNITLDTERGEIETLERVAGAALTGDPAARRQAIHALERLGELNRQAMRDADSAAQELGTAGAWAAVFLGILGMLASGITVRRLQRRVLAPIAEISRAAAAHRAGDTTRRCTSAHATDELALVMATLNELFEHRERGEPPPPSSEAVERALVLQLLDEIPEPALVVGSEGQILMANRGALDRIAADGAEGLREALVKACRGERVEEVTSVRRVGSDGERWLCRVMPGDPIAPSSDMSP